MENEKPSVENLDASDGPELESQEKTTSTLEVTCIPEDAEPPESESSASDDKMTSIGARVAQINKTSGSVDLVTSGPDGSKTSETKDVTPTEADVTGHGKQSTTFGSNEIKTSEAPELPRCSSNLAKDTEIKVPGSNETVPSDSEKRPPSVAEGKGSDEVPAPAVLQLPVPDEAIASGSEVVVEASGLQDVALSDSEEVTLFERDLKSSHQGNPDSVSLEKQISAHQSSQGEKKYLSSIFLQLVTG